MRWTRSASRSNGTWTQKKGGSRKSNSAAWPTASTLGLDGVRVEQKIIREYVKDINEVAATLEPGEQTCAERQATLNKLSDRFKRTKDAIYQQIVQVMTSFLPGLFVGEASLSKSTTISTWNVGFACPRVTSGGSTVIATPGFALFSRDQRWCMLWTHTLRILSPSPWMIPCPIGPPVSRCANNKRRTAGRS